MLPILMAAMQLLGNKSKQAEQEKAQKIAAAQGQLAQMPEQQKPQSAAALGLVSNMFNKKSPQRINGLSTGTENQLNELGFDGKIGDGDSDDAILGGY